MTNSPRNRKYCGTASQFYPAILKCQCRQLLLSCQSFQNITQAYNYQIASFPLKNTDRTMVIVARIDTVTKMD